MRVHHQRILCRRRHHRFQSKSIPNSIRTMLLFADRIRTMMTIMTMPPKVKLTTIPTTMLDVAKFKIWFIKIVIEIVYFSIEIRELCHLRVFVSFFLIFVCIFLLFSSVHRCVSHRLESKQRKNLKKLWKSVKMKAKLICVNMFLGFSYQKKIIP